MSVDTLMNELDDLEETYDYIYNEEFYQESFTYLWNDCILPSLASIQTILFKLIFVNLLFGCIVTIKKLPEVILHLLCGLIGLYFIYTLEHNVGKVIIVTFVGVSYFFVFLKCFVDNHYKTFQTYKYFNSSNIVKCITIVVLVLCQYILFEIDTWMEVRGIIMVFTMKLISLVDDIDKNIISNLSFVQYFGYMCCGSNIMFGPWISFTEYHLLFRMPTIKSKWWLLAIAKALLTSVFFLVISNCIISYFITENSNRWLIAYKEAVSFRTSHYFISFLSEATMLAAGYKNSRFWNNPDKWHYVITAPMQIEIPVALSTVVIHWNKPMHDFLRKYIYKSCVQYGKFYSILSTFVMSSFLHGFELKVSVVLITIGIFSYIQYSLRNYLCEAVGWCIRIYPCRDVCNHKYKRSHILCIFLNSLFSLLSVLHLVFLGMLMDPSTDEEGIIKKWNNLYFISFWIALVKILLLI